MSDLKDLEQKLDAKIDVLQETADEISAAKADNRSEIDSLKNKLEDQRETVLELQDRVDEARHEAQSRPAKDCKTVQEKMRDRINDAGIAQIKSGARRSASFSLDLRVKDITNANFGDEVVEPDRLPDVVHDPERNVHVRDIMSVGQTASDRIRYVQETLFENNFDTVAQGGMKPEMQAELDIVDAPVRTIAGLLRVHKEMLDDIPFLQSMISSRGMYKLMLREDQGLLYGDGTGENLKGLSQFANSQYNTDLTFNYVDSANPYDHIESAATEARKSNFPVDGAAIDPELETDLRLKKDSEGRYLETHERLTDRYNTTITNAVQPNDAFVGQFSGGLAAEIYERQGVTVEVFEQDRDNVPRNLVTVRIEERLALPVYLPKGIQYINNFPAQPPA